AAARSPHVVPELAARARIDGPGIVFRVHVNRAVFHERRAADIAARSAAGVELPRPPKAERFHILVVDLRRRTEPPPGKIAVVSRPRIGGHGRLRERAGRQAKGSNKKYLSCHSDLIVCLASWGGASARLQPGFGPAAGLPAGAGYAQTKYFVPNCL